MKTTKRDMIQDLDALVVDLYAKADDYLRSSKAYTCRSNSDIRAGLVKGAAVMRLDADRIKSLVAKHKDTDSGQANTARSARPAPAPQPTALAEVPAISEAQDRTLVAGQESPDQDAGSLDVSGLRSDY